MDKSINDERTNEQTKRQNKTETTRSFARTHARTPQHQPTNLPTYLGLPEERDGQRKLALVAARVLLRQLVGVRLQTERQ